MKKPYTEPTADETPIGIIISRGSREQPRPMFAAYVWYTPPQHVIEAAKAA